MGTNSIVEHNFKMKPCPFCGDGAIIIKSTIHYPNAIPFYYPTCEDWGCIAHVDEQDEQGGVNCEFATAKEAAEAWNTRRKKKYQKKAHP